MMRYVDWILTASYTLYVKRGSLVLFSVSICRLLIIGDCFLYSLLTVYGRVGGNRGDEKTGCGDGVGGREIARDAGVS